MGMKWCFDIDGVITSNPEFFKWWIFQLKKKNNLNRVFLLTARNPKRKEETIEELSFWGIKYDDIYFMDEGLARDYRTQALWKIEQVRKIEPDIWIDNEFKVYERVFNLDLDKLLPNINKIMI